MFRPMKRSILASTRQNSLWFNRLLVKFKCLEKEKEERNMQAETILITGAGSGLGKLTALTLGRLGKKVIATTETELQATTLKNDADALNIPLFVEKIDITDPIDREKAWEWEIDILVNNAAVKEGGSLVDIPEENFRRQYEVNVFGTLLFTQGFARKMVRKRKGRIIFVSSISGLMVNPFSGPYASSKFAIEGLASTMSQELKEFNVEVATINLGPYLTGFNDREFNTWKTWRDDPAERIFNYEKLAFPFKQMDPAKAVAPMIKTILGTTKMYRNIIPKLMFPLVEAVNKFQWMKRTTCRLGKRHLMVQQAYKMKPGSDGKYMI